MLLIISLTHFYSTLCTFCVLFLLIICCALILCVLAEPFTTRGYDDATFSLTTRADNKYTTCSHPWPGWLLE
jgi:hypothetical protein